MAPYVAETLKSKCYLADCIALNPNNYKLIHTSNTNFSNLSNKMRLSQVLKLDGHSQKINRIGRISGKTQFGNFYLGKPLNVNYLGRMEGMPGGSGMPPANRF